MSWRLPSHDDLDHECTWQTCPSRWVLFAAALGLVFLYL